MKAALFWLWGAATATLACHDPLNLRGDAGQEETP